MASSGSIYKNVGSHYRLSVEWSAKQDTTGNSSTITAKMYWESLDGYGGVNSGATKSGWIKIDGTTYNFSGAGIASLNPNQKRLLATKSKTINHKADGSQDFALDGAFSPEVSLSGTYYGTVSLTEKTFNLNTIPRKSSLSSSADLTAGSNKTISISRASSGFSHKIFIDVQNSSGSWVNIKSIDFSSSQTSQSTDFSTDETTAIYTALGGRMIAPIRWNLHTYDGGDTLGYNTYTGDVSIADISSVKSGNGEAGGDYKFYVDQTITIGIDRANTSLTHTLEITVGSFKKTITGVAASGSWTPTAAEQTSIYNVIGNNDTASGSIKVITFYNGVTVGDNTKSITFAVRSSVNAPTFTAAGITYKDSNPAIVSITANNQYIVQGKSTLQITIPVASRAVAKNGATMVSYSATVNGVTKTATYSASADVVIDFGVVNASTNANATITAIDSRGLATPVIKTINVVPYATPLVTATAARNNGFEKATTLTLRGTASPVTILSVNKNNLATVRYRYKDAKLGTWGAWYTLTPSGFPIFTVPNTTIQLDETLSWNVQVEVTDRFGYTVKDLVVTVGRPIFFVDPDKNSVGIGDFPKGNNELLINGRIVFGATQWASTGQGEGAGALYMNNSDITGANGIYFNDLAGNAGEGLLFLKSGKTEGSSSTADYDNFYIADGVAKMNGKVVAIANTEILWEGGTFLNSGEVVPTRTLTDCPNGWMLIWSRYNDLSSPKAFVNSHWNFTMIPKVFVDLPGSGGTAHILLGPDPANADGAISSSQLHGKYIYATNTKLTGHANNSVGNNRATVLRYVIPY